MVIKYNLIACSHYTNSQIGKLIPAALVRDAILNDIRAAK